MVASEGREVYCILFINLNFIKLLVNKYLYNINILCWEHFFLEMVR